MRDFAKANDIKFYEGEGVCHQVMMENHVVPGELIFGADSHTCAYGALGAFGTGVGCTDYLYAMVTGTSWVMVPGTLRFNLKGKLSDGVYARDLILSIIGKIGANGANYKAMEFAGEGLHSLSMADRISICNLCVEAGAKTALMEVDDVAMDYLKEHGREPKACFTSDDDAVFEQVYDIDLSTIQPIVAKPHFVDNVVPAKESLGVKIDEAFLGSCNNGRIEDLRVGAAIIKGKKVAPKVRFLVVPASRSVYLQAMKEGLLDIFMDAGAIVMNPNCSVCWGSCQGVIGEGETLISTGIGNIHGVYPANWQGLSFETLAAVQELTGTMPLVLHGGTGIPDDMIKKAIDLGVSKINVNTECQLAFAAATRKYIEEGKDQQGKGFDPRKLLAPGAEAIKATVREKIELFGSANKA